MLNNEQEPNKGSLCDFLPDENETNKFLRPGFTGFDRGNSEASTTPDVRTYILFNDHHIIIPKPKSKANCTLSTKELREPNKQRYSKHHRVLHKVPRKVTKLAQEPLKFDPGPSRLLEDVCADMLKWAKKILSRFCRSHVWME